MFLQQSNILKTTSHIALNNVCICTDLNDYRVYASQQRYSHRVVNLPLPTTTA